jgi:hypothetical protein
MVMVSAMGLPSSSWSAAATLPTSGRPRLVLKARSISRTASSVFGQKKEQQQQQQQQQHNKALFKAGCLRTVGLLSTGYFSGQPL